MARRIKQVSWKKGTRYKVKAKVAYDEFKKYDFEPEAILDSAKSRQSPIHDLFEWDDTHAARLYRLQQVRKALVNVRVVFVGDPNPKPRRAILRIAHARDVEGSNYADAVTALSDEESRRFILNRALEEAQEWEERYNELVELKGVFLALERARKAASKKKKPSRRKATAGAR
jgi:hypothetical protein